MNNKKILDEIIKIKKPITIEYFLNLCLYKKFGYYRNSNVLGKIGDFTTAPEISQLFGEIVGLFILHTWQNEISKPFNLIELGPGNGTLILDLLNITKKFDKFNEGLNVYLIEKNLKLIKNQKTNFSKNKINYDKIKWLKNFNISNKKPSIIIANEFFDCFPVRQFFKKQNVWFEKMIEFNKYEGCIKYKDCKITDLKNLNMINSYKPNNNLEISKSREKFFTRICNYINVVGGKILIFDYGYVIKPNTFTLQSIYNNKKSNILDNIGFQDISSLVDFTNLIDLAKINNLKVDFFSSQRKFLLEFGIKQRLEKILLNITNEESKIIKSGVDRLINKDGMGTLFKVLVVSK